VVTANFDQPSKGRLSSNETALEVINDGNGHGLFGESYGGGAGVWGTSHGNQRGVVGVAVISDGVVGEAQGDGSGVVGVAKGKGAGVWAEKNGDNAALVGINKGPGEGIKGYSESGEGVHGETNSNDHGAVVGISNGLAAAVYGKGVTAGFFEGNVEVTGDVRCPNADCAEEFNLSSNEKIDPGTVMVIDPFGNLKASDLPYDNKVAGIISGAGCYRPAIILDKKDKGLTKNRRIPIALIGKVYCKVDASYAPIKIGDLLTTSATKGHAMKVMNPFKALGTIIGKALQPIESGTGMISVLVALQ